MLGGCDSFTQVYQRGYVLPKARWSRVPLGATQEQVLIVLGTPSTVAYRQRRGVLLHLAGATEQKLAFLPQAVTNQRVIAVYFDKQRRVARLAQLRPERRPSVRLRRPPTRQAAGTS